MKSKQYNFYPQPDELRSFEGYLKDNGFEIITVPFESLPFKLGKGVFHSNKDYWPKKYITKGSFLQNVYEQFIETQNYYLIDVIKSYAIELSLPKELDHTNEKQAGRVYFVTGYYDAKNDWVEKNADFIETANKLLNWCKKNFGDSF